MPAPRERRFAPSANGTEESSTGGEGVVLSTLPEDLAEPTDDGAADHLPGARLPALTLPTTTGQIRVDQLGDLAVVFVYPSIGMAPELLAEWTDVPGARGCTAEACSFRDLRHEFARSGAAVLGLSGQSSVAQASFAERLTLPYPLVSDERMALAELLELPTFEFHGRSYYKRLTLIVRREIVCAAIYPVFPPDAAAAQALDWLKARRGRRFTKA